MTQINSRDYVDTGRVNVSDNSENEGQLGDGIFAGIFSSIGENTKKSSENKKSLSQTVAENDLAEADVPISDLKELVKEREEWANEHNSPEDLPVENNEKSKISSDNVTKSPDGKDGGFLLIGKENFVGHKGKDTSTTETLNTSKKNCPQEDTIPKKLSPISKSILSSNHPAKFKSEESQLTRTNKSEIDKYDDAQTKKEIGDTFHVKKKISSASNSAHIRAEIGNKKNQHIIKPKKIDTLTKEINILPKENIEKSESKIGHIYAENVNLNKEKTDVGKEGMTNSTQLKRSLEKSADKKKSKPLEQDFQNGIERTSVTKKTQEKTTDNFEKPAQISNSNLSKSSIFEQKNHVTLDGNQGQSSSSNQQGSQQNLNHIQQSNKFNDQFLQQLDLRDKNMPEGLLRRLERAISNGSTNFEIFLRPKNLGKLRIGISLDHNTTNVRIVTENHTAALLLSESHAKLSQMMESAGLKLAEFSSGFSQENSGEKNKEKKSQPNQNDPKKIVDQNSAANSNIQKLLINSDKTLLNVVA